MIKIKKVLGVLLLAGMTIKARQFLDRFVKNLPVSAFWVYK
jgi:hypothetical protein